MPTPTAAFATPPTPLLRPVQAHDLPALRRFVQGLSAASRSLRFHGGVKPDSERLLAHLAQADGRRHIALVAVLACDDGERIVGEARLVRGAAGEPAELAMAVADAWQGRGLAQRLLQALLAAAAEAGVEAVAAEVLAHNARMAAFLRRAGFVAAGAGEAGVCRWQRQLAQPATLAAATGWRARWHGLQQRALQLLNPPLAA